MSIPLAAHGARREERRVPMVVTIVGGGAFVPKLVEALAETDALPALELRLTARRADRLAVIAEHVRRWVARRRTWRIAAVPALGEALAGAAVCILLVRVGGLAARAHDEAFPRPYGLVGDEGLGPGGIANAYRTVPELRHIADLLARRAPGVRVLNLMAPLGITTRVLLDRGVDAVGVCELPLLTLEAYSRRAGLETSALTYRYGGLNHLGWFWDVRGGRADVLEVNARAGVVDRETLAEYGAAPLHYYYGVFRPEIAARIGTARPPDRARQLSELSEDLVRRFAERPGDDAPALDQRATPWFDRAVAPIVSAILGGPAHHGFVNVRNGGLISELAPEVVVEVAATIAGRQCRPVAPGPLPPPVARFLGAVAESERLAHAAALSQNVALVAQALRALPLPIGEADVRDIARRAVLALPSEPPVAPNQCAGGSGR